MIIEKYYRLRKRILLVVMAIIAAIPFLSSCSGNLFKESKRDYYKSRQNNEANPLYGVTVSKPRFQGFDDKLTEIYRIKRHKR